MQIASFAVLTERQRQQFFEAIRARGLSAAFADEAEMEHHLLGPAFEAGRTYLTLWEGEALAGAVGVVVREIAVKREAFLTLLYVFTTEAESVLVRLLQAAYIVIGGSPGVDAETVVKIGVSERDSHLQRPLERAGWRTAYRVLDMARPVEGALSSGAALHFAPLTAENEMDFLTVANAAFLGSPNGAQLVPEQVEEMRREARSAQFLQVGYADGQPAAVLEVDIRDEVGQIQTVGVAPAFQGRGLGRATVARTLQVLAEGGARQAHLQVVDANASAVALYKACGFVVDRVVSTWYYGPGLAVC
ncbi:MAG: GNAT family N-acetyltransferase [Mycobacterium leprae]